MAAGDLYRLKVRCGIGVTEVSTSMYYEQTVDGGTPNEANELAEGFWTDIIDGTTIWEDLINNGSWIFSVYARKVQPTGSAQDENPGAFQRAAVVGTIAGDLYPPSSLLRIRLVANLGSPAKPISNFINIAGFTEANVTDGAFNAAYLNGPVTAFRNGIVADINGPSSPAVFALRVARDPRNLAGQRSFAAPSSVTARATVYQMRRRYQEWISTAAV